MRRVRQYPSLLLRLAGLTAVCAAFVLFVLRLFALPGVDGWSLAAICLGGLLALLLASLLTDRSTRTAEREQLLAELRVQQAFLETVLEQLPTGVVVVDANGKVTRRNMAYRELLGRDLATEDTPLGGQLDWVVRRPSGTKLGFQDWPIIRAMRHGCPVREPELEYCRGDQRVLTLGIDAVPVQDADGALLGAVSVVRDLTELRAADRRAREHEERFRFALGAARMIAWEWDTKTGDVRRSSPLEEWLGLKPHPRFAKEGAFIPYLHPDDREHMVQAQMLAKSGDLPTAELDYRLRRSDGSYLWVSSRNRMMTGPNGQSLGVVTGVIFDISDRARNEERLRLLESAVVHARDAVVILEAEPASRPGRSILYVNDAFTRMTGYGPDEVVGRSLHFLRGAHSDPVTLDRIRDALATGDPLQVELLNYRKNGTGFWVELSLVPVPDSVGRCAHWVMIQRDISDRRRAEDDLRAGRDGLAEAQRIAHLGSWDLDVVTGIETWSDQTFHILGHPVDSVLPGVKVFLAAVVPEDRARADAIFQASLAHDSECKFECRIRRTDGVIRTVYVEGQVSRNATGHAVRFRGIMQDVTARIEAETKLKQSEELFRGLFENAAAGVSVVNGEMRYVTVNPAYAVMLGRPAEQILGRHISEFTHPDDWTTQQPVLHDVSAGARDAYTIHKRYYRPDGSTVLTELSVAIVREFDGSVRYGIGVSVDITDRQKLEDQLRQAQKMETVGQMAGGIAHDFNNLLTGVLGSLALVKLPPNDPNRPLLLTAEKAAARAADLTRKLLGFARKNQLIVAPVRVGEFATEVIEMLRRTLDPRIEVVADLSTPEPIVADSTWINQALLNLCLNARDAMPNGGRLTIRADAITLTDGEADRDRHPEAHPGRFVRLAIEDTGAGMPSDVRARLFEPFFTTKPVGQGTGLGLAMVHGIVKQHNGWVECESVPGRGTRFEVYLPRAADDMLDSGSIRRALTERPTPPTDVVTPPPRGPIVPRTILLVDDEEMIRDLGRSVLESAGFIVLEAEDGLDAVGTFRERHPEIDLVILDLTMPQLSGRDAFQQMITIAPAARILFSSGYTTDDLSDIEGACGLLPKPYRPNDLVSAVRRVLADRPLLPVTVG